MRHLIAVAVTVVALAAAACSGKNKDEEFVLLGRIGSTTEPEPGVFDQVADGDLAALQKRGNMLYQMERSLEMAYERGAYEVGIPEGAVVLPLVDVDPGGHSAQVVFLRWTRDKVKEGGVVEADEAQRWILVSLLLAPDRVLDVELLNGEVAKGGPEHARAETLIGAAEILRSRTPGEAFHLFTVEERVPSENNRVGDDRQTRVYAMSAEGDGPDLELVLARKKKKKPPRLVTAHRVHAQGAATSDPILVSVPQPGAATVARALLRGPEAGEVDARTKMGLFRISARNGRVERVDGAGGGPESDGDAPGAEATPPAVDPVDPAQAEQSGAG